MKMTNVGLARLQFGGTLLYHFLFVPLTIGLGLLIAILETFYYRSHNDVYRKAMQFWMKIYLVNFAVGVVTGIIQEFQFGTNWADFSRFVGDVFGAPLAIETLMAFFLESTFLGVWIFGWEKLSPKVHLFAIWMVALGSAMSAFWILAANSFMQEPVGFVFRHGRTEMVNFFAVLANPQLWLEFPHTLFGAIATGSIFMAAVSSYHLIRHTNDEVFEPSFRIAMIGALIGSVSVFILGHEQAQHLIVAQPMKMAASEALWHTSPIHAPWTIVGTIDTKTHSDPFVLQIPYLLSILAYNRLSGRVTGLLELNHLYQLRYGPGNYMPPIVWTFWAFRTMIFAGTTMMLIAIIGAYLTIKGKRPHWLLVLMEWTLILPYLSNTAGWVMTEVGRQPWAVFGLLRTPDGVSPTVSVSELWTTVIGYGILYLSIAAAAVYLFLLIIHQGPSQEQGQESEDESSKHGYLLHGHESLRHAKPPAQYDDMH